MTFAIIETGGKQYRVKEGDRLKIEKLAQPEGEISFDKVLLIDDGNETQVGSPYIKGARITAEHMGVKKGKKIVVIHYKAKVRHKKTAGHRQPYSTVAIKAINS